MIAQAESQINPEIEKPGASIPTFAYEDLEVGKLFGTLEEAASYIKEWCDKNDCPLIVRDSSKKRDTSPGHLRYLCPHAYKRIGKSKAERPKQHVHYSACQSQVNIWYSNKEEMYRVTKCIKVHQGHLVGAEIYRSYRTVRKLTSPSKNLIKELDNAGASHRCVADVVQAKTGNIFGTKDIYNHLAKFKKSMMDGDVLEKYLARVETEGGTVKWKKSSDDKVVVLWIQTYSMKKDIARSKPWLFQTDTTFGTNRFVHFFLMKI